LGGRFAPRQSDPRHSTRTHQSKSKYRFSPAEYGPLESPFGSGGGFQRHPIILVVEDESVQAIFLQRMLRRLGYETPEHAVSGPEAIEKAARFSPYAPM